MDNLTDTLANSGLQRLIKDAKSNEFFQKKSGGYKGVNKKDLMQIYLLQKGECALCGDALRIDTQLTHIDHIVPRSKGGTDTCDNFALVCATCNYAKRDMSLDEFVLMCTKIQQMFYKTDLLPKSVVEPIIKKRWQREVSGGYALKAYKNKQRLIRIEKSRKRRMAHNLETVKEAS